LYRGVSLSYYHISTCVYNIAWLDSSPPSFSLTPTPLLKTNSTSFIVLSSYNYIKCIDLLPPLSPSPFTLPLSVVSPSPPPQQDIFLHLSLLVSVAFKPHGVFLNKYSKGKLSKDNGSDNNPPPLSFSKVVFDD
jgi:hypothetical protein